MNNNFTVPFTNGDAGEPGCWIDGHWGQYGADRLIAIALNEGWILSTTRNTAIADCALGRLDDIGTRGEAFESAVAKAGLTEEDVYGYIIDLADEAEEYLNTLVPDTHAFGWHDGEFFLWPVETWQEDE